MADKKKRDEPTTLPPDVKVQARMPPFWREEPEIWFSQIEGQFAIAGITDDTMQFHYVISLLERPFSKLVKDIIISPPAEDKYKKLKSELIKRLSDFNEKKPHRVTINEDQIDRKPSRILRNPQTPAPVGDKMEEEFFLNIQAVGTVQPPGSLDALANLADKLHDIVRPTAQVSSGSKPPGSNLAKEIADLRKQVEALTTQGNRKSVPIQRTQSTPVGQPQPSELGGQKGAVPHSNSNTDPLAGPNLKQQRDPFPYSASATASGAFNCLSAPTMMQAGMPLYQPGHQLQRMPAPAPRSSYNPIEWVPTTRALVSSMAHRALVAGKEGWDGSPLWVIRAHHCGEVIPGKLAAKQPAAYVPFAGEEVQVDHFEILCVPEHMVKWVSAKNGDVPSFAIIGGYSRYAEPLYVCRTKYMNSIIPGKVHPSYGCAFISYGGIEVRFTNYEVLCKKTRDEIIATFPEI